MYDPHSVTMLNGFQNLPSQVASFFLGIPISCHNAIEQISTTQALKHEVDEIVAVDNIFQDDNPLVMLQLSTNLRFINDIMKNLLAGSLAYTIVQREKKWQRFVEITFNEQTTTGFSNRRMKNFCLHLINHAD